MNEGRTVLQKYRARDHYLEHTHYQFGSYEIEHLVVIAPGTIQFLEADNKITLRIESADGLRTLIALSVSRDEIATALNGLFIVEQAAADELFG